MEIDDAKKTNIANVVIKKSTFNKLILGVVVISIISAFFGGYFIGVNSAEPEQIFIRSSEEVLGTTQSKQIPQSQTVSVSIGDDPMIGNPNAPITIIEFSDFQCPFCHKFHSETFPLIQTNYINTGKVNFVYRDFPIQSIHPNAMPSALAAECANEQGKFWEYHDKIFENQGIWNKMEITNATKLFKEFAAKLNLNQDQFNTCLDSGKYVEEVNNDLNDGRDYGVTGTPGFFIGNDKLGYTKVSGAKSYQIFQNLLDDILAK